MNIGARRVIMVWFRQLRWRLVCFQSAKENPPLIAISSYHFIELALAPRIATSATVTKSLGEAW